METMELREDECFISDIGNTSDVKTDCGTLTLGRYAVIKNHSGKMQVLEVGGDLEYLMKKFNVPKENVGVVTG